MKGNEALDALVALCDVERVDGKTEGCGDDGSKMARQGMSTSQATGLMVDRNSAPSTSSSSHLHSTLLSHNFSSLSSTQANATGHTLPRNYSPYIQFLHSQMLNAQQLNSIQSASLTPIMDNVGLSLFLPKVNDFTSHGSNNYQNPLNPLLTSGQLIQHLSEIANGTVYSQLINSLKNANSSSQQQASYPPPPNPTYSTTHQHEFIDKPKKTVAAEVINHNSSAASSDDSKKRSKKLWPSSSSSTTDNKKAVLSDHDDDDSDAFSFSHHSLKNQDKKTNKRAANRLSAQLSRRRRKMFMEELKVENETLRRKESILNSIPDLVIVFDSAGKIAYISKSVCAILKFKVEDLQESSFWGLLCADSERLLKAAFMDSLAAKEEDTDSVPLGQGVWEIRMIDKDESKKLVALHGVVHFTDENPQCVCTIRPLQQYTTVQVPSDIRHAHPMSSKISTGSSSASSKESVAESLISRGAVTESTTDGF